MQPPYNYSREKATSIAAAEWDRKGQIEKVKVDGDLDETLTTRIEREKFVPVNFPKIFGVPEEKEPILIKMIQQAIGDPDYSISFNDMKTLIPGLSPNTFGMFLNNFKHISDRIAKYYNKPNRFKIYTSPRAPGNIFLMKIYYDRKDL
jgi:hypothetical protein